MRIGLWCAIVMLLCAARATCAANSAEVDFTDLGTTNTSEVTQGIARVLCFDTNGQAGTLHLVQGNGLGVVGGVSDQLLDSNESLRLSFGADSKAVAISISYTVNVANDGGNGTSGETTVYGYGAGWTLLGFVHVSGTGTKFISTLFSTELSGILIVPRNGDSIRIEDFGLVAYGPTHEIDFDALPGGPSTTIDQDKIVASGFDTGGQPADVSILSGHGLGVVGGPSDTQVDSGEIARFAFDGVAGRAWYQVVQTGNGDGDGLSGEVVLYAWGANGHLLGSANLSGTGVFDVSRTFGGQPISFFSVLAHDSDWVRIRRVMFACPGPVGPDAGGCAADLNGDGDTNVSDFGIFVLDFGCHAGN